MPSSRGSMLDSPKDGMAKSTSSPTPWYPDDTSAAPEYSQLPEVSAPWSGTEAPEPVFVGDADKSPRGLASGVAPQPNSMWASQQQHQPPPPLGLQTEPQIPVLPGQHKEAHAYNVSGSPATPAVHDEPAPRKKTVLILSILVGVLSAAVIGLAAATGVMAKRANDAESALPTPQSAIEDGNGNQGTCPTGNAASTTTTITSTATAIVVTPTDSNTPIVVPADVSNGCNDKDEKISGSTYTTRIFNQITFLRYCNAQPKQFPIYGMLTPDFEACMDACAAWTYKGADTVGKNNPNRKCGGVRFVPAWTNKTIAYDTNARGNCFLQVAPQVRGDLKTPDLKNGVTCHAAIVVDK